MTAGGGDRSRPRSVPARPRRLIGDHHRGLSPLAFGVLAVLLGAASGFGAYVFRVLIAVVHNAAFLGRFSHFYDPNVHTAAAPWGLCVALVPAVGAVVVVFLIKTFAPEARGHGVPEVMDAIYYQKSVIRPIVAVIKAVASALSIGTGGSVGREGPMVQIAAGMASVSGSLARVSRWQRATLVAAGGGAGIAAAFNTPLGGILFAVEILMHEVSARTLVPVALATATATYVIRFFVGNAPSLPIPQIQMSGTAALLPAYVGLGILTALASVLFIRTLYGTEDFFERAIPGSPYLRHVLGMLGVGMTFAALFHWTGHYYVEGVGYATLLDVLTGGLTSVLFLLVLFVLKLLVTSTTLGTGASGGVFSPSLFMGATLGAVFGRILQAVLPALFPQPAVFALAGMAGVLAGATGAALTSIAMMFEMTLNYQVILPVALTAAVSYGLRRLLLSDSIYTMKLARRGHAMPEALQANAHLVHHVEDIAMSRCRVYAADDPPGDLELSEAPGAPAWFVILDRGKIVGVVSREWALGHASVLRASSHLADVAKPDFVIAAPETTLFDLLAGMQRMAASVAVVATPTPAPGGTGWTQDVQGVVTRSDLAEALAEGMELFED